MDSEVNNESMNVPTNLLIHSPAEFESLLLWLSRLLEVGALKQCNRADLSTSGIDLRRLEPDGPWPDIVEAEFVGVDGQRYHLFVDTFHGVGGHWRALS